MSSKNRTERQIQGLEEAVRQWGKLLARDAFPGGHGFGTRRHVFQRADSRVHRPGVGDGIAAKSPLRAEYVGKQALVHSRRHAVDGAIVPDDHERSAFLNARLESRQVGVP